MVNTTKKMLAHALAELLKTKPLNKITISDITGRCGVNRMTFYYHFKDIYELVGWTFMETSFIPLEKNLYSGNWRDGIQRLMENALENKSVIMNVFNSLSREQLEGYFTHVFKKLFDNIIDEMAEGMDILPKDKEFVAYFYNKAFCGLVLDWISSGMKEMPAAEADMIGRMLNGNMEFSLNNMRRDKN